MRNNYKFKSSSCNRLNYRCFST